MHFNQRSKQQYNTCLDEEQARPATSVCVWPTRAAAFTCLWGKDDQRPPKNRGARPNLRWTRSPGSSVQHSLLPFLFAVCNPLGFLPSQPTARYSLARAPPAPSFQMPRSSAPAAASLATAPAASGEPILAGSRTRLLHPGPPTTPAATTGAPLTSPAGEAAHEVPESVRCAAAEDYSLKCRGVCSGVGTRVPRGGGGGRGDSDQVPR